MRKRIVAIALCIILAMPPHSFAADTASPDVQTGRYHALMLRSDGALFAWGDNRYGQVGDGTATNRSIPALVLENVVSIAAGLWASYAVTADGQVYTWGNNEQGQLGLSDYTSRSSPSLMGGISDAVAVAASQNRAYILTKSGDVYAFGNAPLLYPPDMTRLTHTPRKIATKADAIFAGGGATMFLRGHRLFGFGSAITGSVDANRAVREMLVASFVTHAAASDTNIFYIDMEHRLYRYDKPSVQLLSGVVAVSASDAHQAAVGSEGLLYTWGENSSGELGHGDYDTPRPTRAVLRNIAAASAGDGFTVAIGARGELWSFGSNTAYRLGSGTNRLDYNAPHRVLAPSAEYADAESLPYRVVFNGDEMTFDTPPIQRGGRVLVPLRAIFERIGADVTWDDATQTAISTLGDTEVRVTIDSRTAYVGGEEVTLDVAAIKTEDWRTLVPLRFVSESFGATVEYIASERIIEIRTHDADFELTADAEARVRAQSAAVRSVMPEGEATLSGVAVHAGGLVLTNRHGVEDASEVYVNVGGEEHRAEVYYIDQAFDYAILKIGAATTAAKTATLPPRRDDIAVVAALPTAAVAHVTETRYGGMPAFVLDCTVQKGTSGSGVYNRDMELVGIVYGGVGELSYAACVPYSAIREMVAAAIAYYGLR